MHPFRDGAPLLPLLIVETPPTFGRSLRFFHILHRNCLLILSPSCFAVCGNIYLSGRGGGITQLVHGRSRMTIDPRIPTMPGRSTRRVFTNQASGGSLIVDLFTGGSEEVTGRVPLPPPSPRYLARS